MRLRARIREVAVRIISSVAAMVFLQSIAGAEEPKRVSSMLHHLTAVHDAPESKVVQARNDKIVITAAYYDDCIQADSYSDPVNAVPLLFEFSQGGLFGLDVSLSLSPPCGSVAGVKSGRNGNSWWATSSYHPCEDECSTVTIRATATPGGSQTRTIHLDERQHTGCGHEKKLMVSTWEVDTGYPFAKTPAPDFVEVRVVPPEAGTATPRSGHSQLDSDGRYVFPFTYAPSCTYAGRVRITSGDDMISYDQNTESLEPSPSWQTVCEDFCTEGCATNYCQVYKVHLSADCGYDFSLHEGDGVGARCDAPFYTIEMFDSAGNSRWYVDNLWNKGSTLGTPYESWAPLSDGSYYLHVSGFDFTGYATPMSYCLAYKAGGDRPQAPDGVAASDGTHAEQVHIQWRPAPDADEYRVYRADSLEGSKRAIGSWQSSTSYDDSPPKCGAEYYYWVKSRNCAGESTYGAPDTGWCNRSSDRCESAMEVLDRVAYPGTTIDATGSGECGCGHDDTNDVWYSYTPARTGFVNMTLTGATFDTALAVYGQCDGIALACNSNPASFDSHVVMAVPAGATLLIRVAGNDGTTGDYTLTVTPGLASDLNDSNNVDFADFATLASSWWHCTAPPAPARRSVREGSPFADADLPASPDAAILRRQGDDGRLNMAPHISGIATHPVGDLNGDFCVDVDDLVVFFEDWHLNAETPDDDRNVGLVGIHRLWSPTNQRHFYTADDSEKEQFLNDPSEIWEYRGTSYYAYAYRSSAAVRPVYRFYSPVLSSYFYTISPSERNRLIRDYADVWHYEQVAFYAFPEGNQPGDTAPIYGFWSDSMQCHFFTTDETTKDNLINVYAHLWTFEGVAWYAHAQP